MAEAMERPITMLLAQRRVARFTKRMPDIFLSNPGILAGFFMNCHPDTLFAPEGPALLSRPLKMEQVSRGQREAFSFRGEKRSGVPGKIEQKMVSSRSQGIFSFRGKNRNFRSTAVSSGHDVEIPKRPIQKNRPGFPVSRKAGQVERFFHAGGAVVFVEKGHALSFQKQEHPVISREIRESSVLNHSRHADTPEKLLLPGSVGGVEFRGLSAAVFPGGYPKGFGAVKSMGRHLLSPLPEKMLSA
jgi:hypothetical protein